MNDFMRLRQLCEQVRFHILTSTTQATSGHPTSSLSATELMTTLFFGGFLKYDITHPHALYNDRIIFSKGHAAPLLYSLWTAAGAISKEELLTLRQFGSTLEGHPTPNFPYVDVATGSLGQGLSVGVGMAMAMRLRLCHAELVSASIPKILKRVQDDKNVLPHVFVLLGDSELAEGQNWEAMEVASYYKLNNLIGILDVNRLGQRGETMLGWDLVSYQKRIESFGWRAIIIENGHDIADIVSAFGKRLSTNEFQVSHMVIQDDRPTMFIAKTIKGKGISFLENKDGWHGKTIPKEHLQEALTELGEINWNIRGKIEKSQDFVIGGSRGRGPDSAQGTSTGGRETTDIIYHEHNLIATREAYGKALVSLGKQNNKVIVLDAETSNSTFADSFKNEFPDRFFEMFIAEQNMVSMALGFSRMGFVPFISSFAAFLTRAFDQIRMSQYSMDSCFVQNSDLSSCHAWQPTIKSGQKLTSLMHERKDEFKQNNIRNINIIGSHAGCSIGPDGASQMALEDITMMRSINNSVVLYPSDAMSTFKLTHLMAQTPGINYLRTTREKTPVIYNEREEFRVGGCKIHLPTNNTSNSFSINQQLTTNNYHVLVIAAGITLHEALKAQKQLEEKGVHIVVVDLYSVKPLDEKTVVELAKQTNHIIVVEDHYQAGGIGEAVSAVLTSNQQPFDKTQSKPTTNCQFTHLCVRKTPHSGTPEELLKYEEIDAEAITQAVLKSSATIL